MEDLQQLLAALADMQQNKPTVGSGDIAGMLAEAQMQMARGTNRLQRKNEGQGLMKAANAFSAQRDGRGMQDDALRQLQGAYDAQEGVDQYQGQANALQARIEAARAQELKRANFDYETAQKQANEMARIKAKGDNVSYNITPPKDHTFADPNDPKAGYKVIPGSPTAREIEEVEEKKAMSSATQSSRAQSVIEEIDYALANLGPMTTGIMGQQLQGVGGTPAFDLGGAIKSIKANLGFDRLTQMRAESPTGGALGQVSNIELELLTSSVANLEQATSQDELQRRLAKVRKHYMNFVSALDGAPPEDYPVIEDGGKKYININGQWEEME